MRNLLVILLVVGLLPVYGQRKPESKKGPTNITYKDPKIKESGTDWKKSRLEWMAGAGICGFLGDLGGQDGPGQPFIIDFEPTQMRYSLTGGMRYYVRKFHSVRGTINYARVRGSDATTNYPNRKYRNLNFKSPIIEVSASYEFHLLRPKTIHLAGARTTRVFDGNRFGAYLTAGAGFFYFNPKTQFNGQWYALKPLSTEGQGMPGGPKAYKRFNLTFPLGGGLTYLLNWNYTIGLDVGYRWTTTDYIDDASGYYYDNATIVSRKGKLAGTLANPSVLLDDVPDPDWYTAGQPRGGSESNDTYLFVQVTLSHTFGPSITNKKFKPKKQKMKKSRKAAKKQKVKKAGRTQSYGGGTVKNKKKKFKDPKLNFGKKRKKVKVISF